MTKQELRRLLKERRAKVTPEERKRRGAEIVSRLAASPLFANASALLIYAPMEGEINLLPLARLARENGIPVAFPRCDTESNTMRFYILEPSERLVAGAYGIPEPPEGASLCEPDSRALCILPALGFDPTGARLGYGKGYYDRFLADFVGVAVGAVWQDMLLDRIPTEAHDRPVSHIFTERGVLVCSAAVKDSRPDTVDHTVNVIDPDGPVPSARCVEKKMPPLRALWTRLAELSRHALHAPPILVCATFLLLLLSRLIDTHLTDRNNEYAVVILLQLMIFAIPAILYGMLRGDRFSARLRIRPPRLDHVWFLFCMLAVMVSGGMLCGILTGGIASLGGNFTLYDTFVARMDGGILQTLYVILAYCLLPAFCEELVFRAILCAEYETRGVAVSIPVSALFFAMLHFDLPLFPTYFFLGLLLAASLYTTRSFFAPLLLHVAYNLFCLFGRPYLSAFYVNAGSNEIFVFCLVVILLLFGAFAAGEARKIYHRYASANLSHAYTAPTPIRTLPKTLFLSLASPASALALLIWLLCSVF